MISPKVTTAIIFALASLFQFLNADLAPSDASLLIAKTGEEQTIRLVENESTLHSKRGLKKKNKKTWAEKKSNKGKGKDKGKGGGGGKGKRNGGKGKGGGKKNATWSTTGRKGKGAGGKTAWSTTWSGKSSKGKGKGKGKGSKHSEELTFLDQIQYPYDAWLPQEDSEDAAQRLAIPSLSQPFYNNVIDVRATVSAKDVVLKLSAAGNWQFALTKLLNDKYFPEYSSAQESYLITTSPPISIPQLRNGRVKVGNILYTHAEPTVATGPPPLMIGLREQGFAEENDPFPFHRNYGNIILKLKGNTDINGFADLAHIKPGRFASSGPAEVGATTNYKNTIRGIVINYPEIVDATPDTAPQVAEDLVFQLFDKEGVATIGPSMHQSIPHVLVTGQADAGLMFLELAVMIMTNNPGVFEAIYLAKDKVGMTDDPAVLSQGQDPLDGNVVVTMFATKTKIDTPFSAEQEAACDAFLADLMSEEFTAILAESGLRRPV